MARKKTRDEIEQDVLLSNVRELLKTRYGKDVLWHILSLCDLYGDTAASGNYTYYHEGQRSVGLSILRLLEAADPTAYARLLLDQQNKGAEDGRTDDTDYSRANSDGQYDADGRLID